MTTKMFALASTYPIITSIGCGIVAMGLLNAADKIRNSTIRSLTQYVIGLGLGISLIRICSTRITYVNSIEEGLAMIGNTDSIAIVKW